MSKIVLSLTGHRPNKLDGYKLFGSNHMLRPYYQRLYNRLVLAITNTLSKYDTVECHSGMALGADTIWALAIVAMKEQYPNRVTFVAEIPDYNQPSRWFEGDRVRWQELINQADSINTYASQNPNRSYAYILNQRNIGMIQACDILIAVYNGDATGGTANGVRDGKRFGKRIVTLDPELFR